MPSILITGILTPKSNFLSKNPNVLKLTITRFIFFMCTLFQDVFIYYIYYFIDLPQLPADVTYSLINRADIILLIGSFELASFFAQRCK